MADPAGDWLSDWQAQTRKDPAWLDQWRGFFSHATGLDPDELGLKTPEQAAQWYRQNITSPDGAPVNAHPDAWYGRYRVFQKQPWAPTRLPPDEEARFQDWTRSLPWFSELQQHTGLDAETLWRDISSPEADYDLRGAYKAGMKPQRDRDGSYHWQSRTPEGRMLKSPRHETAWKEFFMQQTGMDPAMVGLQTPEDARDWLRRQ